MAKSKAKKWFGIIHLWIGLISGILVLLISISGCVYVFRDELFHWAHKDVLYIKPPTSDQHPLPLKQLWDATQQHIGPQHEVTHGTTFIKPNRSWEFKADKDNDSAISYFNWIEYDYLIYINPYTAEVVGVIDHKYEFFQLIKMFHWSLLLHTDYGQPIVGTAVLLFVISLITGLVLWWPKNKKILMESIRVKWNAKWRRVNYDLHRVVGFYSIPLALIVAITGLAWAFKWVQALIYVIASLSITPPKDLSEKSTYNSVVARPESVLNLASEQSQQLFPDAYSISFYHPYDDSTKSLDAYVRPSSMVYYNTIVAHYDQGSGKLIKTTTVDSLNNGQKILYMNYDIHVGQILGLPGKILAFIVSLLCASLPVTGFMVWWGRRKKQQTAKT